MQRATSFEGSGRPTPPATHLGSTIFLGDAQHEDVMMKIFPNNFLATKFL
jgi:hypothetical protein